MTEAVEDAVGNKIEGDRCQNERRQSGERANHSPIATPSV